MSQDGWSEDNVAATVVRKRYMFIFIVLFIFVHPMISKQSPTKTSLVKISKSTGGRVPHSPDSDQARLVKTEPLDEVESLHRLRSSKKPLILDPNPIVISSDEGDTHAPQARPKVEKIIKAFSTDKFKRKCELLFISLSFLISELSAPSTPRTKDSGKASSLVTAPSDESDAPTPRAKAAKIDDGFSSNKSEKMYVIFIVFPFLSHVRA